MYISFHALLKNLDSFFLLQGSSGPLVHRNPFFTERSKRICLREDYLRGRINTEVARTAMDSRCPQGVPRVSPCQNAFQLGRPKALRNMEPSCLSSEGSASDHPLFLSKHSPCTTFIRDFPPTLKYSYCLLLPLLLALLFLLLVRQLENQ